ncbi:MAG TPA: DEDD exonuclease domain-containing protein [Acidimicrobiales bacterium]|nr:DEDD exonuclease domain-containing protein [Acidimicrobiales bacterium]
MQRSFDDLGTPLHSVTFCVVDLETTGAAPATCAITEVGAVRVRGGECLGTFSTLVNPGVPIPPEIVVLTGITEAMVLPAPPIEQVLPAFLEFAGDAVVVGHNVRFDLGFLQAAAAGGGYQRLANRFVDTCALARRLVRDEVPDCRLSTLARRFRLAHQPTHRALDDALATVDLLHALLERAGSLGVLGLDDLLELPTIRAHPQVGKLRLTAALPRRPGVYLFRGRGGRVLYVGKATDLRGRVRSYFSGDERRKVGQLLRETESIDHVVCPGPLEAAVLEVRLIQRHLPPFNRRSKLWRRYAYVKLTLNERFPRLSVVRTARPADGCIYVGPLPSMTAARVVADAIESAVPIRRCTARPGKVPRDGPCTPAQLGVATCPCAGTVTEAEYGVLVRRVVEGLTTDPSVLLEPLCDRMSALARSERFEEAAAVRDRAAALARALDRQGVLDRLRRAGRLELDVVDGRRGGSVPRRLVLAGGRLLDGPDALPLGGDDPGPDAPLPRHLVDELSCVASWLEAEAHRVRLVHCDGELASPLPAPAAALLRRGRPRP